MNQLVTPSLTRADEAFDCLQTAIVKGELAPGEKIGEVELCERFNLTRGPLREALGRLESRGLLVRRPHAGVKVVSVSAAELIELYRIREVMEGLAARQAAERMTDEEIRDLQAMLDSHERLIDETQKTVNGVVRLDLYKGNVTVTGRKSPNSIYSEEHVTFEADTVYNQRDAEGFIKLNALRLRLGFDRDSVK